MAQELLDFASYCSLARRLNHRACAVLLLPSNCTPSRALLDSDRDPTIGDPPSLCHLHYTHTFFFNTYSQYWFRSAQQHSHSIHYTLDMYKFITSLASLAYIQ